MEFDFKIILYIVFFVIYILAKALRKSPSKKLPKKPRPDIDQRLMRLSGLLLLKIYSRKLPAVRKRKFPSQLRLKKK